MQSLKVIEKIKAYSLARFESVRLLLFLKNSEKYLEIAKVVTLKNTLELGFAKIFKKGKIAFPSNKITDFGPSIILKLESLLKLARLNEDNSLLLRKSNLMVLNKK